MTASQDDTLREQIAYYRARADEYARDLGSHAAAPAGHECSAAGQVDVDTGHAPRVRVRLP